MQPDTFKFSFEFIALTQADVDLFATATALFIDGDDGCDQASSRELNEEKILRISSREDTIKMLKAAFEQDVANIASWLNRPGYTFEESALQLDIRDINNVDWDDHEPIGFEMVKAAWLYSIGTEPPLKSYKHQKLVKILGELRWQVMMKEGIVKDEESYRMSNKCLLYCHSLTPLDETQMSNPAYLRAAIAATRAHLGLPAEEYADEIEEDPMQIRIALMDKLFAIPSHKRSAYRHNRQNQEFPDWFKAEATAKGYWAMPDKSILRMARNRGRKQCALAWPKEYYQWLEETGELNKPAEPEKKVKRATREELTEAAKTCPVAAHQLKWFDIPQGQTY
jgi:ferredoxin